MGQKSLGARVMIGHYLYAFVVLDFVLAVISGQKEKETAARPEASMVKLFNGKDMTGLHGDIVKCC